MWTDLERKLMSPDLSGQWQWHDPKEPITSARIAYMAQELDISVGEVQQQCEMLAAKLQLELSMEWRARS